MPTGTGKTYLAVLAIERAARPAWIVTPTIDLLHQWYDELTTAFGGPIGLVGGGHYDLQPLTVTTYDSAYLHLERRGAIAFMAWSFSTSVPPSPRVPVTC